MTLKKTRHGNKVILFSVQFFQEKRRWLGLLMILSSSRQNFEKLNVGLFLCLYRECQSLIQLQEQRKRQQYGPIPSKHCLLSAWFSLKLTHASRLSLSCFGQVELVRKALSYLAVKKKVLPWQMWATVVSYLTKFEMNCKPFLFLKIYLGFCTGLSTHNIVSGLPLFFCYPFPP